MSNAVFYHSNCYDGFGAAYAAWKKFGDENTTYHPVSYGFPAPEVEADNLYIVDFSYKKGELLDLLGRHKSVIVLDHHKTAQEELEPLIDVYPNLEIIFDMNRSGAKIAWEYFHSSESGSVSYNQLIEHISDRDLWRFELENSKTIHKALVSYPMNFELWDSFKIENLVREGLTCERLYGQLVENICKHSFELVIDGHKVPAVNTSIAWSEVGAYLLEKHPEAPFVASFTVFDNQTMWSLRSKGEFDVSAVAKKFGGGGHKNAAGFKTAKF